MKSRPISTAGTECVNAPTEMKSTPVSALPDEALDEVLNGPSAFAAPCRLAQSAPVVYRLFIPTARAGAVHLF